MKIDPASNVAWERPNAKRRSRNRVYQGLMSSAAFLASRKAPTYLVDGLIERGKAYTLSGRTGHGKTLVLLLLAIRVALKDWFCGRKCRQGTVAFFAGENPENVKIQFYAMCADLCIDGAALPIVWHEGVFDLDEARKTVADDLAKHPDLALLVFDSQQAFFLGEDDNANMAILDLAIGFREMGADHPGQPAILVAAHPVKNADQSNLLPRGGGAMLAEFDGNLTCWLDLESNIVTLHWHGKLRGAPFEPIKLETAVIKPEGLVDAEGNQMPCTVVRPLGARREAELEEQAIHREKAILQAISDDPAVSQNTLATKLALSRSTVQRTIARLKERRLVRQMFGKWVVTEAGEKALKMASKEA